MKKTHFRKKKRLTDNEKPNYTCQKCDFSTYNKTDYNRHLKTNKHKKKKGVETHVSNALEKTQKGVFFLPIWCECNRYFKTRSGLWKHKKKCEWIQEKKMETNVSKCFQKTQNVSYASCDEGGEFNISELKHLQLENARLKNQKLKKEIKNLDDPVLTNSLTNDLIETIGKIAGNNNCNNTNNISINMYLNEKCKNAMNLEDFVKKITVSLQDLAYSKENGYAKGITNIFIKQLKDLSPTERPIHCSDQKRMSFYIRDDNKWEKDKNNVKITNSIKNVGMGQIHTLSEWEKLNPTFQEDGKLLTEWQNTLSKITPGTNKQEIKKNEEKIKKELSKAVDIKPELSK